MSETRTAGAEATLFRPVVEEDLAGDRRETLAAMTFPAFRHMVQPEITSRHPEQGDRRAVRPVLIGAWRDQRPIGLLVAELPVTEDGSALDEERRPEVLSVFVQPQERAKGVGTGLLRAVEEEIARLGGPGVQGVWTTGKPEIEWLEKILRARGWSEPKPRTLSVRFSPQEGLDAEMFAERRMRVLAKGLEIFPWSELTDEEREWMQSSNAKARWIQPALEPWKFDQSGFDPSSVGARYKGRVVGWVINHRVQPDVVRYTCSFMRKDLSRRGRILPLYHRSLERLRVAEEPCRLCTFVTPFSYDGMIGLIQRWIAPWASFVSETRGSFKKFD